MENYSEFNVDDKVIHPKKPEWGLGTILKIVGSDRLQIHFSHAGIKTIALKFITLKTTDKSALPPLYYSIAKFLKLEKVKQAIAPQLFAQEFTHTYKNEWRDLFFKQKLAQEIQQTFSQIFSEDDLEYILNGNGKSNRMFYDWWGAILAHKIDGYAGVLRSYMFDPSKDKILREQMGMQQYIAFQEAKRSAKQLKSSSDDNTKASASFGIKDAPTVFMYNPDSRKSYFVCVRHVDEKINLRQQKFFKAIKENCNIDVYLISIRAEAKKQSLKQYQVYKDIAKAKVSKRSSL